MTHAELVAAVERVRKWPKQASGLLYSEREADYVYAHLDTLAAILNLHTPDLDACAVCSDRDGFGSSRRVAWPCPTVGVVADALRKMGNG